MTRNAAETASRCHCWVCNWKPNHHQQRLRPFSTTGQLKTEAREYFVSLDGESDNQYCVDSPVPVKLMDMNYIIDANEHINLFKRRYMTHPDSCSWQSSFPELLCSKKPPTANVQQVSPGLVQNRLVYSYKYHFKQTDGCTRWGSLWSATAKLPSQYRTSNRKSKWIEQIKITENYLC